MIGQILLDPDSVDDDTGKSCQIRGILMLKDSAQPIDLAEQLVHLVDVGISLSSVRELETLLPHIVQEARHLTSSDGGSLYVKEFDSLRFEVSQNTTIEERDGHSSMQMSFLGRTIPISLESLAGYVAATGRNLNIEDACNIPADRPFRFNRDFDLNNNYRSKSMLLVPMRNHDGVIIGVLQLINRLNHLGDVISYDDHTERIVQSLASQAAVAIENVQLCRELEQAHFDIIKTLSMAAEARDQCTGMHIERVGRYSEVVALRMGIPFEEAAQLRLAASMHDVGKLHIPDSILHKPGKLTPEEFEVIKSHSIKGAEILSAADNKLLRMSREIARSHHEKWDGSGYPDGLAEETIPLWGRIVAIADVFDALSQARCYKPPVPLMEVRETIKSESGRHFDPAVVKSFIEAWSDIETIFYECRD
jgi:HD-GYP domain-containing protein (c-di-GMP phosphodiesterase class II)